MMRQTSHAVTYLTILGLLLSVASTGCGGDPGYPFDSGMQNVDVGELVPDGGQPVTDGGQPVTDGGQPVTDGGQPVTDGGEPVTDGGEPMTDGGQPMTDGGEPPGCVPMAESPLPTSGNLYFVAASGGSDSNAGTKAQPFATIQRGINLAVAGDTIVLRGGTYKQAVRFSKSGTAGKPITLRNYPGEKPVVDNQYSGNAVVIQATNYAAKGTVGWVTVEGLEVTNPGNKGIEIVNGHDLVVRRCYVHGARGQGITGNGTRILIDGNVIADNGDFIGAQEHGIYGTGTRWTVSNNLIYRNAFWGIQVAGYTNFSYSAGPEFQGASDWLIVNNTFALQHRRSGIVMYHGAKNNIVQNNIFYNNRTDTASGDSGVTSYDSNSASNGHQLINNLHFGPGAFTSKIAAGVIFSETGTVNADPLFTNPSNFDFHLKNNSPAKNKGATANAPRRDHEGKGRPQGSAPDIGALELCE